MRTTKPRTAGDEPVTAADMPVEVRRLLKSYALDALEWGVPQHRHAIVVEILTRGDAAAERWLWSHCTRESVGSLLRTFAGAGCDDEAREVLRRKLGLSETELPRRPFAAIPWRG